MTDEKNLQNIILPESDQSPQWYIDEGIPGVGNRPTWLSEKFKSAADLAKSYSELEKKFGSAPEEYDFSKSKYLDPDYVPFLELKQIAKDKRVPKEVMDKMLESVDKYMDEFSTDYSEEYKKLGDNAKDRISVLDNWAQANLSKDSYEALVPNIRTAESIKALEELRGKMMSTNPQIPNGNDGTIVQATSIQDLQMELNNNFEKYKTDATYRKDLQSRMEIVAKNNPGFIDKIGS